MDPLLNQGYSVILDNWFSSPGLFSKLCSKQTDAMGTFRQNRKGVPAEIKSAKLKKRELVSVYKDRLMIMKWINEKAICLTSVTHEDKMVRGKILRSAK